jgi:hypothetical protein
MAIGMGRKGSRMKPQIIAIALALVAAGASLSAMSGRLITPERQVAAAEFDFKTLHRQANDALDNLRVLQERRREPPGPASF